MAKIEEFMDKLTPVWKAHMNDPANPEPTAQTEDAFRKYIAIAVLSALKEAFPSSTDTSTWVEASVNFRLNSQGGGLYEVVCTGDGWIQGKTAVFDNN